MPKTIAFLACVAGAVLCGVLVRGEVPEDKPASEVPVAEIELIEQPADPEAIPAELTEPRFLNSGDQAADRALRQRCRVRFRNLRLDDVLRILEAKLAIPIRIDEEQLADEGLSLEEFPKIIFSSSGLPVRTVLNRILTRSRLAAVVDDGEIVVLPRVISGERLSLRQYPVADLVAARLWNGIELQQLELVDLLRSTVGTDSWDEVGGPGSIKYEPAGMSLIIRQSQAIHEEIESMLTLLREERRRLPRLLKAAGGPELGAVHRAEASDRLARKELTKIEDALRALEAGAGNWPGGMGGAAMGGMGGFFDVAEGGAEPPVAGPAEAPAQPFFCGVGMMVGNFQAEPAADARRLAFRAMRLALRFEGVLPAEEEAEDVDDRDVDD